MGNKPTINICWDCASKNTNKELHDWKTYSTQWAAVTAQWVSIKVAPQIDEDPLKNKACHGHSPLTASFPKSIYDSANVGDIEATPHSFKYIFKK